MDKTWWTECPRLRNNPQVQKPHYMPLPWLLQPVPASVSGDSLEAYCDRVAGPGTSGFGVLLKSPSPPPHPPPPAVFPLEICPEGPCLGLSKYLGKEKYRQSEKPSEREREYFFCCVMVCTAIHHLHHSGLADLPRVSYDHDHFSGLGG